MPFLEDRDFGDVPSIPEYYSGKAIFITGGTGFLGKVLIEKLLYSCPDLDRIYLLMRNKMGVNPKERLAALYASNCFDRLRTERPEAFGSKVSIIPGDCNESGLGISEEDKVLIVNKINIVFHSAASVRFDDPLKVATKLNIQGTKEVIELAKCMQHLESFIHVSTSYSNTNHDPIEEIMYPPLADWRDHLEICNNIDDYTLQIMTKKYLGEMPNTYAFTKQLAEHLVYDQKGKLPLVIMRPSIVISSDSEPMAGWIDNFNGPIGMMIASAKGVLRTLYCDSSAIPEYIPVDFVVKSFISAAWIRGTKKLDPSDDIPIYNCCAGRIKYLNYKDTLLIGINITKERFPLDDVLWTPGLIMTTSQTIYKVNVWLQHLLPAIIVDSLLWIFGKKPMLIKIQRKIYIANLALHYYMNRQWSFSIKNFLALRSKIKEEDKKAFYSDVEGVDINKYYTNGCIGAKRYLLKEKDENIPKAKAHLRRLQFLDKVLKCIFYGCVLWFVMKIIAAYVPSLKELNLY